MFAEVRQRGQTVEQAEAQARVIKRNERETARGEEDAGGQNLAIAAGFVVLMTLPAAPAAASGTGTGAGAGAEVISIARAPAFIEGLKAAAAAALAWFGSNNGGGEGGSSADSTGGNGD